MAFVPKFFGTINESKRFQFAPRQKELFDFYVGKWPVGKELELTVKSKFKKRTSGQFGEGSNQNGYYWGVVVPVIAEAIGEADHDSVHYWLQVRMGNVKVMPGGGRVPAGTSNMSTGAFAEFVDKVLIWARGPSEISEHGLVIPDPNE